MKKFIVSLIGILFNTIALASGLSYDQIPITPQTWEEVDLTYINTIDGKKYTEYANLLRPIIWIKHNHLDKVGTRIHLTREQLGIDADIKIIAIKPTTLNYSGNNNENFKPIIATFITHSNDIWDYNFKDQYGHKETIQAVSGHPFYSEDRHTFILIRQFKIGEQLKNYNGSNVKLADKYKHNQGVEVIYNVEVFQAHKYEVGKLKILVNNMDPKSEGCSSISLAQNDTAVDRIVQSRYVRGDHHYTEYADGSLMIDNNFIAAPEMLSKFNFAVNKDNPISEMLKIQIMDENQKIKIRAHGTPHFIGGGLNGEVLSTKKFARILTEHGIPFNDEPIRLQVCETAECSYGVAQQLANELNIPIEAPETGINGDRVSNNNLFKTFYPQSGLKKMQTKIYGGFARIWYRNMEM